MEKEISLDTVCIPSKDVVALDVEGKIVIVPLENGIANTADKLFTLSDTGRAIWEQLDGKKTLGQLAEILVEEYSAAKEEIGKDVIGLVTDMVQMGACLPLHNAVTKQVEGGGGDGSTGPDPQPGAEPVPGSLVAQQLPQEYNSDYIKQGSDLRLSNPGQLELLLGMRKHGVALCTSVRGFSMHPFIKDQDVLTIEPLKGRRLMVGDIVAFKYPQSGRLAIHRIIMRKDSGWLMKGDNCQKADGIVIAENIIGRVVRIERNEKEVHLGLGVSGRLIAFLNRGRGLDSLKKLYYLPRRGASFTLRHLQGLSLYRKIARLFMPPVIISEADEKAMAVVHRYFNPGAPFSPKKPDPNVTNFVATTGSKVVGFAQLVYHPEEHFPWVGYWLFSLFVWGPYRGLGIGEKLVRRRIEAAKSKGASELLLVVYEDNKRAISLNCKLGFVPITLPALEPLFEAEKEKFGRRRIVMKKALN